MVRIYLTSWFFLVCLMGSPAFAQVNLTEEVRALMEEMQLEYIEPVERFYQSVPVEKNIYLKYDMAVQAPDVNLEVRYVFRPEGDNMFENHPNVHAMSAVSSVATNHQDEDMLMQLLEPAAAKEAYNADWAAVVDFVPKYRFNPLPKGRMLAIYAEGKGSVFIFFFYDVPSRFLEDQIVNIRFKDSDN